MRQNVLHFKLRWKLFGLALLLFACSANSVFAQTGTTVIGVVTDAESNEPLPGVNIIEEGTSNGAVTDFDGKYELTLKSDNASLVFSSLGFLSQTIEVNGRTTLNVVMSEDAQSLSEVVVVGYGTQKKSDLTGAIASVGSEALTERNTTSALEAVQGNVAGVQISSSTGRTGDGFNVVIRGQNSTSADSNPLFVVDGVPTDDIDFLNPQDIAQLDVLKDASSTAIYGSRGSNGVVIITTKSGSSARGGFNVTLDSYAGVKNTARLPELMGGEKWWLYHRSAYLATSRDSNNNGTIDPDELEAAYAGTDNDLLIERANRNQTYDWYDAVLKPGIQQNHYLNVNGRSENGVAYNIGLGYQTETGNIENEALDKYTLKAGLNHNINDKFSYGVNLTVASTENELGSPLAMQEAFRLNPFLSPWAIDDQGNELVGTFFPQPGKLVYPTSGDFAINKTSTWNPLLEIQNSIDNTRRWNMIGSAFFQYAPTSWLSFKTTYSAGLDMQRRGRSFGALTNAGNSNSGLPLGEITKSENFNYTWDNQFNIDYTFEEKHNFKLLGLQSVYSSRTESSFASATNLPFDTSFYNLGSGPQNTYNLGTNFFANTLSSYALRLNYSYDDKYLLTLSNRWDGSSLLSEGNRWDSFPSGAIGWRVSQEDFMAGVEAISNLKLRVSYGFTGNNIIRPYATKNILNQTPAYYNFGDATANGFLSNSLANNTLTWERTRELNVGLDFGFFNERISGSIDVYDRLSDDLLENLALPLESGFTDIAANVGSVSNKGVEIALKTRIIQQDNISLEATITYTKNTNKLESYQNQSEEGLVFATDDSRTWRIIGQPLGVHYNYKFDGIWQADEATEAAAYGQGEGQARVVDFNGDGTISPGNGRLGIDNDRVVLGSSNPDWSGSFFTSLRVYDFDFSLSVITNQGVLAYSPYHQNFTDVRDRGRQKLDIADWYIPANDAGLPAQASNSYPQARNAGRFWRDENVGYYRDASFVKVKNIALGYNFNSNILDKLSLKKLRVYLNVLNPFVFSDYDGYDPEWAAAPYAIARPSFVTTQLGLSVKF